MLSWIFKVIAHWNYSSGNHG